MSITIENRKKTPRLAIVGCGAIAETFFLPALAKQSGVIERLILVDVDQERVVSLAEIFGVRYHLADYHELLYEQLDGVIVATPHNLHYPITMDFLENGVHVLCEKPLAESSAQAKEMVNLARKNGVKLCVNNTRRLFPSSIKVKELITEGHLGDLISMEYYEGGAFSWPTTSGFYFNSKESPKGVLLDRGGHVLDLACWWLGEKPDLILSQNDSFGGPEAVTHIQYEHGGCQGKIKLSWLFKLGNVYRIEGTQGAIEGSIYERNTFTFTPKSSEPQKIKLKSVEKDFYDFGNTIISNFLKVISGEEEPLISGAEVLDSIKFIEESYNHASRFEMPWYASWVNNNGK